MSKKGHLWGIGVGPGDPGLLTLQALQILEEATVVFAPRATGYRKSAAMQVVEKIIGSSELRICDFPMTREADRLAGCWREVAGEIAGLVEKGEKVVFLTLGDALTYSTYNYVLQQLADKLPPASITTVPGVTSFAAACAAANFPLVCGGESLAVIPLPEGPLDRVRSWVRENDVVVFMKLGNRLPELLRLVNEEAPGHEAVFASRVGVCGQFLCTDINHLPEQATGYMSVLIVRKAGKTS